MTTTNLFRYHLPPPPAFLTEAAHALTEAEDHVRDYCDRPHADALHLAAERAYAKARGVRRLQDRDRVLGWFDFRSADPSFVDHVSYWTGPRCILLAVCQPYGLDLAEVSDFCAKRGMLFAADDRWSFYYPGHANYLELLHPRPWLAGPTNRADASSGQPEALASDVV